MLITQNTDAKLDFDWVKFGGALLMPSMGWWSFLLEWKTATSGIARPMSEHEYTNRRGIPLSGINPFWLVVGLITPQAGDIIFSTVDSTHVSWFFIPLFSFFLLPLLSASWMPSQHELFRQKGATLLLIFPRLAVHQTVGRHYRNLPSENVRNDCISLPIMKTCLEANKSTHKPEREREKAGHVLSS